MAKRKTPKKISAEEFDRKFDNGEDVLEYMDLDNAVKRVTVDFPLWMIRALDFEASRLGISRQAVIKTWLGECMDQRQVNEKKQGVG